MKIKRKRKSRKANKKKACINPGIGRKPERAGLGSSMAQGFVFCMRGCHMALHCNRTSVQLL